MKSTPDSSPRSRRSLYIQLAVAAVLLVVAVALGFGWLPFSQLERAEREQAAAPAPAQANVPQTNVPNAEYVGSATCKTCHAQAFDAWQSSDHAKAMAEATDSTVHGNFNNVRFNRDGIATEFFRRDGGFFVRTDGEDGKPAEFPVRYTFGHYPLQQYLVPFSDGRLQALSVAWDSRAKAAGGQRWFHLYPGEKIDHTDALHWTGPALNWDGMCAECHSTGLKQSFDAASQRFGAKWSEIDVACEACHGPASRHVDWARAPTKDPLKGLTFALHGATRNHWQFTPGHPIAKRQGETAPDRSEVETCAYCHARRSTVSATHQPGQPLAATHQLALLEEDLYFADGQQKDEVFEHGSFLQSKMFRAGVTCSNCHDPHSGKLRAEGNAVCAQCHQPAEFDTPKHHHHAAGTTGSQCVSCHMPARNYMVIDARRDHSFSVPRPDLSTKLEAPNACNGCHEDRKPEWAAQQIAQWHPNHARPPHFGEALQAGRRWSPGAPAQLEELAAAGAQPPIARATALQLLARYPGQRLSRAVEMAARDADPLLRQQAAAALPLLPEAQAGELAGRLLADSLLTVRAEAAQRLLELPPAVVAQVDAARWQRVLEEVRAGLEARRYRAEALLGLAALARQRGDAAESEALLRQAVKRQPQYAPGWINLSEALRQQGRAEESRALLVEALQRAPEVAVLHYAMALAEVRAGKHAAALAALAQAVKLAPEDPQYVYTQAIALHDTGAGAQALKVLEAASQRFPGHTGLLSVLAQYAAEAQRWPLARKAVEQLEAVDPEDPALQQFRGLLSGAPAG